MTKVKSKYIEIHILKVVNGKLKFLLLKRSNNDRYPGIWQMVTGHIKKNEKAYGAAIRELKEETSLTPKSLYVVPIVNSLYLPEKDEINFVPVFVCEVESDTEVKISNEHSEFKWVSFNQALKMVKWDGQKRALMIINENWGKDMSKFKKISLRKLTE